MISTERGFYTYTNHIVENSKNFINFSTNTKCEKEQIEYSYFELEKVFGSRKASFINRLNYWLNKCGKDIDSLFGKWIYNPTHEWAEQLNCSPSTIKRLIKSLEEQGIILSKKVNAKKYNQTKWYSINYKLLQSILKLEDTDTKVNEKKWTNRLGQNEPIIVSNSRNNYTNISSDEFKNSYSDFREEEINFSNSLKESKAQQTTLTNNKNKLVEQMVKLWNKVFEYSLSPISAYSNKSNSKQLFVLLQDYFSGDLDQWQEYAKKVNSSQFLMGEKESKKKFKAVFHWLIKEETIDSIMGGAYGVGDRELDMNRISENVDKQEKELITTMRRKLTEHIKIEVDEEQEKQEFTKYVRDEETDEDEYGLKNMLRYYDKYSLLHLDSYAGIKQSLYESYLMKKHLGVTSLETKRLIEKKIKKIRVGQCSRDLFKRMKCEKERIENTWIEQGQSAIGLL